MLLVLSIAYSLPLYSGAISELISGIGISSIKTPFLELTVRERGSNTITAAAKGSPSNSGETPRPSDPRPGLDWLTLDTDDINLDSTLPSDEGYIRFFDNDIFSSDDHKQDLKQIERFRAPAKKLSSCLQEYIKVLPDSGLLLVDIKPVIESMFMLHARARDDLTSRTPKTDLSVSSYDESHFWNEVNKVLTEVNKKFDVTNFPEVKPKDLSTKCMSGESGAPGGFTIDHRQPYSTLVLADLLHAHGSPDEAIAVLAEWFSASDFYRKTNQKDAEKISKWWQLRVMSRIAILMLQVAGQNNIAYRDFFDAYKRELESYFAKSNVTLGQIHTKCKVWHNGAASESAQPDVRIEQKAFYVLLEAEDESLRTEVNFIGEEGKVERLENLHNRAAFLASVDGECLPGYFAPEVRKTRIADYQI
ncbi:MAG TPA: hypothetical protein VN132_15620, partial [Bdellovibrio sp.]|nr:hypothetical protein [Bdellovibrio sp.]